MENNYPGQLLPIIVFSAITILYIFIKYHNSYDIFSVPKIYFFIYLFSVILSQIFINVYLTKKICGSEQFFSSFLVTFIPWILIFVSLNFMIYKFPGWLKPFSNTFGYLAISYSLTETFNKILMAALNKSPCCINNKESNENVEKVVKAPKNPIPIKVLWILISNISCSINWYNKPIINEPVSKSGLSAVPAAESAPQRVAFCFAGH